MLALAFVAVSLRAADVELVRVWPGWRDAEYFDRIGQFFGRPATGSREVVVRTEDAVREGFYFLVRLKHAPAGPAKFEVNVIRPDTLKPVMFEFPVTLRSRETVYQLGLTGSAWPEGKAAHPVAWMLVLKSADGRTLAEQKSFLWEKPPPK